MGIPLAVADLVADERVARGLVGDSQQRLGQAHQRDTFLAGEGVFLQQGFDQPALATGAQHGDQVARGPLRLRVIGGGEGRFIEDRGDRFGLRAAVGCGDRGSQCGLWVDIAEEGIERGVIAGGLVVPDRPDGARHAVRSFKMFH